MALTTEQQAELELQAAMENSRTDEQLRLESRRGKLSAVQIATNMLVHNRLDQAAGSREITASEVTAFADTLVTYIES